MTDIEIFCRQIRKRSTEHKMATMALHSHGITSQVMSILRQELDSMVRVIYLLHVKDIPYRNSLIKAAVEGQQWTEKGKKKKITDRDMVNLAQTLQGWTESVYRFGCAFIHLSSFHDYQDRDPMAMISEHERKDIIAHITAYHGAPHGEKFQDLLPLLPMVFDKISDNLEYYLGSLEKGGTVY